MSKIMKCDCAHEYQNEKYGNMNRVHNELKKVTGEPQKYRCSVCEKVTIEKGGKEK